MVDKDCRYCGGAGKFQIVSMVSDGAYATCFCSRKQVPTEDAYMRACRALHWRTEELRAHGVEPMALVDDMPYYPPKDYDFGVSGAQSDREAAIGEHAFAAGFAYAHGKSSQDELSENRASDLSVGWAMYTPPEFE